MVVGLSGYSRMSGVLISGRALREASEVGMTALCRHEVVAVQRRVSGMCFLLFVSDRNPKARALQAISPCIVSSSGRLSRTLLRVRLFNLEERVSRLESPQLENVELAIGASMSI